EAEHIPGCNMAFRRSCLRAIGGFDPQFRVAGDDVDVCWRLQQHGWTLGFSPAAVVWHHRRNSVRTYLRQQKGYGKAEAMLERKWPEKYNVAGHLKWSGRVYGIPYVRWRTGRIYHGIWGLAPFQSLYEPAPTVMDALPMMPEWYLLVGLLGGARMFVAVEYHGDGRQLLRIRSWPRCSAAGVAFTVLFGALAAGAAHDRAWSAGCVLGGVALLLVCRTIHECAAATAAFLS